MEFPVRLIKLHVTAAKQLKPVFCLVRIDMHVTLERLSERVHGVIR